MRDVFCKLKIQSAENHAGDLERFLQVMKKDMCPWYYLVIITLFTVRD